MGEKDLWFEFKKWAKVREVFIAKKKNRSGQKYGFARFNGVVDVGMLEYQLDNMIIGGLKLYATGQKVNRTHVQEQRTTEHPHPM